MSDLTILRVKS